MNYSNESLRKKQKALSSSATKLSNKLMVTALRTLVVVVAVGIVCVVCAFLGAFNGILETAPSISINDVTPSQYKTTVYDSAGNQVETLVASGANRIYVPLDEIPTNLQNAFIAIEDERFWSHNGIDAKGIIRAAYIAIKNNFRATQGASTITQQLIKNSLFEFESERTLGDRLSRKIQEQYLALDLEKKATKQEILENYLNTINLGNNNLGVQSAAKNYFNKDVSALTLSECAVIAAITQNPSGNNPIRHPEKNMKRRNHVLDAMLEQELITKAEYDEAINDDVYSRIMNNNTSQGTKSPYSYYTDTLIDQIMDDLMTEKGYTYTQAYNLVYRGGLSIYSCEDHELQKYSEQIINDPNIWHGYLQYSFTYRVQYKDAEGKIHKFTEGTLLKYMQDTKGSNFSLVFGTTDEINACIAEYKQYLETLGVGSIIPGSEALNYTIEPQYSFVVIDNETGAVRVVVGGRGEKTESLVLNRAVDAERQAGSSIKPLLVYAPAIDSCGYSLGNVLDDVPFYYDNGQRVKNNDEKYLGFVTLRQALAESRNTPALNTLKNIGIQTGLNYLKKFGLTTLTKNDNYLPVALGTNQCTNLEMTSAYSTFANGGIHKAYKFYTKVLDHDGNIILDKTEVEETRVLKESTAFIITSGLHSVIEEGTLKGCHTDELYLAAKSGTTQNAYDRWVIGYGGKYTMGAWVGYDQNKEYEDGYGYPYIEIWQNIMLHANEGYGYHEPEIPDSVVKCKICKDSGLLAVEGLCDCDERGSRIVEEFFEIGTAPTQSCSTHVEATYCKQSDKIACDDCPKEDLVTKIRIVKDLSEIDLEDTPVEDSEYAVTKEDLEGTCDIHGKKKSSEDSKSSDKETSSDKKASDKKAPDKKIDH